MGSNRVVITGATGMLGAALVRCALDAGREVLCIVRRGSERLGNVPQSPRIEILHASCVDYRAVEAGGDYDVFFHLAWETTVGTERDNVDAQLDNIRYTLDAVRLAHRLGCTAFVGAGSQSEYGRVSQPLTGDLPANPEAGYGIAKYAAGKLSGLLCSQLGLRHNWIRVLSAYGPHDRAHTLVMHLINELQAGRSPALTPCEQTWDYLYCDDAARAFLAVGDRGVPGKAYPLGSGKTRKLSEYVAAVRDIVSPGAALRFGEKAYYPHQPMYLCADISELTADTGWLPETTFEEGIQKTANYPPPPTYKYKLLNDLHRSNIFRFPNDSCLYRHPCRPRAVA